MTYSMAPLHSLVNGLQMKKKIGIAKTKVLLQGLDTLCTGERHEGTTFQDLRARSQKSQNALPSWPFPCIRTMYDKTLHCKALYSKHYVGHNALSPQMNGFR